MEAENLKLEKQLQSTIKERQDADRVCEEIFAFLEEVCHLTNDTKVLCIMLTFTCPPTQIENEWRKLPLDDMQTWILETAEAQRL